MSFIYPSIPLDFLLGLALRPIGNGNFHIGFIYRANSSQLNICHLCWHHDLRNENFTSNKYLCEKINLNNLNQKFLTASIKSITDINSVSVPYGIKAPIDPYDDENKYVGQSEGEGLTCATFVMSVFEKNGYNIINKNSWKIRNDDQTWQEFIIESLKNNPGITKEYEQAARDMIGEVVRFRPDEVFACGSVDDPKKQWDIDFEDAEELAKEVKKTVTKSGLL